MTIVGCRIDGRLIHGQVANLWTTKLNVSRIMVIDDEVAQNDIEKSGLKLATPPGVKLSILPVAKAAENILDRSIIFLFPLEWLCGVYVLFTGS